MNFFSLSNIVVRFAINWSQFILFILSQTHTLPISYLSHILHYLSGKFSDLLLCHRSHTDKINLRCSLLFQDLRLIQTALLIWNYHLKVIMWESYLQPGTTTVLIINSQYANFLGYFLPDKEVSNNVSHESSND